MLSIVICISSLLFMQHSDLLLFYPFFCQKNMGTTRRREKQQRQEDRDEKKAATGYATADEADVTAAEVL